jgi:hypothetical protein
MANLNRYEDSIAVVLALTWPELLRRLAEAVWTAQEGNHVEDLFWESQGLVESSADILLPPLTLEQTAEVEARLGPISPDVKDMLLVAKVFYGTSRLARV